MGEPFTNALVNERDGNDDFESEVLRDWSRRFREIERVENTFGALETGA